VSVDIAGGRFKVVVNHEEQYSIWPEHKVVPSGWREIGKSGSKQECLSHVKEVWTDMRPLSLRETTANKAKSQ
jgi:MbtH protein